MEVGWETEARWKLGLSKLVDDLGIGVITKLE